MKKLSHHHCSFCNAAESNTRRVFLGPGRNTAICGECVAFSQQVLRDRESTDQADGECSFCGKAPPQVKKLACGPGVNICSECIAFAQRQLDDNGPAKKYAAGAPGHGLLARLRSLLSGRAERTGCNPVEMN